MSEYKQLNEDKWTHYDRSDDAFSICLNALEVQWCNAYYYFHMPLEMLGIESWVNKDGDEYKKTPFPIFILSMNVPSEYCVEPSEFKFRFIGFDKVASISSFSIRYIDFVTGEIIKKSVLRWPRS